MGKKVIEAYRYFYEKKYGPIPAGKALAHDVCENPICVNPDHVVPAESYENAPVNQWHSRLQRELNELPF